MRSLCGRNCVVNIFCGNSYLKPSQDKNCNAAGYSFYFCHICSHGDTLMSPYFTIFGRQIPYYGLLFMLGFFAGAVTALPRGKKYGIKKLDVVLAACFAAVGGLAGAKLLSVLTSIEYIIEYNLSFIDVMQNGFVFYGGLIGGVLGLFAYIKIYKINFFAMFDIFAVSVPLGHAIGRVGCFLSGCCFGIPYDGPLSYTYETSIDPNTPIGVPLLPVQLIESFCLLVLYAVLEVLFAKTSRRGISLVVYMAAYSVIRFTLEFFRGDIIRGFLFGLSTSQWISLAIMLCAAALCFVIIKRHALRSDGDEVSGDNS